MKKLLAAGVVLSTVVASGMAGAWWGDNDYYYDRPWRGGPWYGGHPGYGWGGYPGYGWGGYPGYGWGGYPGYGWGGAPNVIYLDRDEAPSRPRAVPR